VEALGMYGPPTAIRVAVDPDVKPPIARDRDYPVLMAGYSSLLSDGMKINVAPYHQVKPLPNGLSIKLAVLWRTNTPKEIYIGHEFHLAMEFSEAFKILSRC
jgi:hypothetical protein